MNSPHHQRTPWYASIVTRITLVFAVLLLGTVVVMGWLSWRASRTELISQAHHAMDHTLDVAVNRLQSADRTLRENLDLLATNLAVMDWCAALDTGEPRAVAAAKEEVATFMDPVIRARTRFAQVRVIGADPNGMEVVRFDRAGRDVYQVPEQYLQAKGDRGYYRATMAAPAGARLSFPIDLNREHEKLERPFVPTLRVSAPLFTPRGDRAGLVVINADMRLLFTELLAMADSGRALILARGDGEVVLHPDTSLAFRFELGRSMKLDDVLPRGGVDENGEPFLIGLRELSLGPSNDPYVLAITEPMSDLLGAWRQKRNDLILLFAAIIVRAIVVIALLVFGFRARLNRLTGQMERYAVGSLVTLPTERRDEFGRMARGLRTMQDRIDARMRELEAARSAAEASDRQRRELLANMSHEVRTPLNAILGMGGAVDTRHLSDADRERMAIVQRSAERLKGLVDDLLMHARIGEGKLVLRPAPVDVRTLVGDVVLAHLPAASEKGLELTSTLNDLPEALLTDALRLHQVVDNLVGNAVRFTEQGHITIEARMNRPETLCIRVSDTGPGIPASERERVFERFERATASEQEHGAGLGLAITKRVIDLLGGTLQLQSDLGQGSTFTVLLPVSVVNTPAPATTLDTDTRGARVLYVEDVATNRMLVEEWASRWVWKLSVVDTGEEALVSCEGDTFELLLIDLQLGRGMGGTDLARQLRTGGRHAHVPMIALTAHASDSEDADILQAGMNDRVTKPVDREQLHRAVAFWCDRSAVLEEPDLQPLAAQYDGDAEKLRKVHQQYRSEFTERRLALRAALQKGDRDALREARHALRPHWQLLGLSRSIVLLDALSARTPGAELGELEETFRACDRAFLRALRDAQAVVAGVNGARS